MNEGLFLKLSGQFPPRNIAPTLPLRLGLGFGFWLALWLGVNLPRGQLS